MAVILRPGKIKLKSAAFASSSTAVRYQRFARPPGAGGSSGIMLVATWVKNPIGQIPDLFPGCFDLLDSLEAFGWTLRVYYRRVTAQEPTDFVMDLGANADQVTAVAMWLTGADRLQCDNPLLLDLVSAAASTNLVFPGLQPTLGDYELVFMGGAFDAAAPTWSVLPAGMQPAVGSTLQFLQVVTGAQRSFAAAHQSVPVVGATGSKTFSTAVAADLLGLLIAVPSARRTPREAAPGVCHGRLVSAGV